MLRQHFLPKIALTLLIIVTSCAYHHKKSHGTMQIILNRDTLHVKNLEYLEAMYANAADLMCDSSTGVQYLSINHGSKYVFAFHSELPPPTFRIIPPKRHIGYYLFVVLDPIIINDTINLDSGSIRTLFYRYESSLNSVDIIEASNRFRGEFVISRTAADTICGHVTFSGKIYDFSPRKIYRTFRWISSRIDFKAQKKSVKKISSYFNRVWLPREILIDFLEQCY